MRGVVSAGVILIAAACSRSALPPSFADTAYWRLIESLSEPPGKFDLSENLVSNEPLFVENVRRLRETGGVYIGVGPEQNYSYIARVRPALAFIIDIRRENQDLHFLYKALFELSNDRADFVSRLFSRPRPAGLGASSSVDEIFAQVARAPASLERYDETRRLVLERLLVTRALPLQAPVIETIERILHAFFTDGPDIDFWRGKPKDPEAVRPSYRQLMTARDATGAQRSFLATEQAFAFVKALHTKNLILPVVGDFGGPSAIRRTGDFLRDAHGEVAVFYGSNVSVYLNNQQAKAFCASLATLPAAPHALFVDREDVRPMTDRIKNCR